MYAIEVAQQVKRAPARLGAYALGVRKEKHWIALGTELHALIAAGKKTVAPAGLSTIGLVGARQQHNESRQVAAFAAEPVGEPRPHARPSRDLMAGTHEDLPGRVVELRGVHRLDDGDIVDNRRQVRQQVRELRAALAVTREVVRRAQQFRRSFDEREPLALDDILRNRPAVVLI